MSDLWHLEARDVREPTRGLAALADKSIDHVITDPPYDDNTHGKSRRGITNYKERTQVDAAASRVRELGFDAMTPELMRFSAEQFARLARRWVMTFCTFEMVHFWKEELERAGLEYVRCMVWWKKNSTPQLTGDRPGQACEAIVLAHPKGKKHWNGMARVDGTLGRGMPGRYDVPQDFRSSSDLPGVYDEAIVINRSGKEPRLHTAQKPLGLMERLVADFTDAGELVLDPFAGSCTTGMACLRAGRRFLGYEFNPKKPEWAEMARLRMMSQELSLRDAATVARGELL